MSVKTHSILSKKIDIFFLIVSPLVATVISLYFKVNYITNIFLYFGLPALYLSVRNKHAIIKSTVFSLIMGVVAAFLIDYVATFSNSWLILSTVFHLRVLNIVPIEDIIWGFLVVYDTVMFYEHLLDKGRHNLKDTKVKYLVILTIFLLIVFLLVYWFNPAVAYVKYFYFYAGIAVMLLPVVSYLSFFPRLISKFIKAGTYFFVVSVLYEFTGLYLNQWTFTGNNFIGWVKILGLAIPFEEVFFYLILFNVCILSYYEFFYDDNK